jgi:hypothetical protein
MKPLRRITVILLSQHIFSSYQSRSWGLWLQESCADYDRNLELAHCYRMGPNRRSMSLGWATGECATAMRPRSRR